MANVIKDEILRATVQINADPARKEMQELERKITDLQSSKRQLQATKKQLEADNKRGTQAWKENRVAIEKVNAEIKEERRRLAELGGQLKVATMSIVELKKEKQRLNAVRVQYGPSSLEYQQATQRLQEIENRLRELTVRAETSTNGFSKFSSFLNKNLAAIGAITGAAAGMFAMTNKAVSAYAELDDKMSDVMKTTGLTKEQVERLNTNLSKLDTRSSQIQLMDLAKEAGKLGIEGAKNVEEFVVAADKINVALGEDLGGEEAITHLGKIVDLFKIKEEYGMAEGMIKAGSAVNSLGAASTANEGFIVNFAKRLGGIGSAAKMTLPDVLGLGATLDALGQRSESSSTAVGRLITGMFQKTADYAKVAGMKVKEFLQLLNTAPNEALVKVLEGVSGNEAGLQRIITMLGEVGINSSEAKAVISSLSQNVGLLKDQQSLANIEFEKGTSILDENAIKNDNAQARIEKAQNAFQRQLVDTGKALEPVRASMISSGSFLLKLIGLLIKYKGAILSITVASVAYVVISKLKVFWSKANRTAMVAELATMEAATAGTKLLAAAKLLLVGNLRAAATAFKLFFASIGPIGWLAIAIGAIGTAISVFTARTNTAVKSVKDLIDVENKAAESIANEKREIERLVEIAKDKNRTDEVRLKALNRLKEIMPEHNHLLTLESINTDKASRAIGKHIEMITLRAKARAAEDMITELEKEKLNAYTDKSSELGSMQKFKVWFWYGSNENSAKATAQIANANGKKIYDEASERQKFMIEQAGKFYKELEDKTGAIGLTDPEVDPDNGGGGGSDDKKNKKAWSIEDDENYVVKRLELKKKRFSGEIATEHEYARQLLAIEIETLEARIALDKEKGEDKLKLQGQLFDKQIEQQQKEKSRLEKLIEAADSGKTELEKEKIAYDKRLKELGLFNMAKESMNAEEQAAFIALEKSYNQKLTAIHTSNLDKEVKQKGADLERKLAIMQHNHIQELRAADTLEKRKSLLLKFYTEDQVKSIKSSKQAEQLIKKAFANEELQFTSKHLEEMLSKYKSIVEEVERNGTFRGIVLTDEEREKLLGIILELEKKLNEARGKQSAASQEDPEKRKAEKEATRKSVNFLGASMGEWEGFFELIKKGKFEFYEIQGVVGAIGNAFGEINKLFDAINQRDLKSFEKAQKDKLKSLDKRHKAGLISEDAYNSQVTLINEQTDLKKQELERKQAERAKALAVFQAIVNTATAVTAALGAKPWGPWNIALAAAVGLLGAVQIGTILAQPIGYEEGGFIRVQRAQDGKVFDATQDPNARGPINKPTVLVAENGTEYVVPNEGYENPTVKPVLDILERARRTNTLRKINLPLAIQQSKLKTSGKEAGGYSSQTSNVNTGSSQSGITQDTGSADKNTEAINKNTESILRMVELLSKSSNAMSIVRALSELMAKYDKNKQEANL